MNFLEPTALAFAATLPIVVLFYLLKRKRVVKLVSSTLLWQKFLAETQASAPFQRLRHNWLLILQLLLLTLVILALGRPYFASKQKGGRMLVAILDASASMQARDETPSRFEKAKKDVGALIDNLQASDQMVLLLAGAHTEVKQSPTANKSALRRALAGCAVTSASGRMAEALRLAQPLVKDRAEAEIHLFSDGATTDLSELENEGLRLVYHRAGTRAMNVGIVTLDVRPHPEDPTRRAVFASFFNATTNAVDTEVELRFNGQLIETRPLTIGPRETLPQVFSTQQTEDGIFTLLVMADDDLPADNIASIGSALPQPTKVLLVTRGNRFLEKALAAAPNTEVTVAKELADTALGFDFVVLDGVMPVVWPEVNTMAVQVARTNWFEAAGKNLEAPAIVDVKATHPLLRFTTLENVQIAESMAVKTPPWALAVVEASEAPLILAGELEKRRVVWLAFDPLQSTWPLRISFPIFVANAVEWLSPATVSAARHQARPGQPLRLSFEQDVTEARITPPGQKERVLPVAAGARDLVFGDTLHEGLYHLQAGTNQVTYCVNLLDPLESDTTPRGEIRMGKFARVEAASTRPANLELWRWLSGVGLAILLFEWWYYHRRTA